MGILLHPVFKESMTVAGLSEGAQLKVKTCLEEWAEEERTHIWARQPAPVSLVRPQGQHEDHHRVPWRFEQCKDLPNKSDGGAVLLKLCSAAAANAETQAPVLSSAFQTVLSPGLREEGLQSAKQSIPSPSSKDALATTFYISFLKLEYKLAGFITGLCHSVIICCICSSSLLMFPLFLVP